MPRFTFDADAFGRAFGVAKIVKPMTGNYSMKFRAGRLTIYSSDKRRYARAEVLAKSVDGADDGYESEEFYVAADRQTLLDSDLKTITLSLTDKGITVRAEGDGQTRNATLKKRADNSRHPPMPPAPDVSRATAVKARTFADLLRQVSCSAQVRDTKTEEDMKVNQVHFYADHECAMSTARFCGSSARMNGLSLDLSVVSADLPAMKTFCSKSGGGEIGISQDKSHLILSNPATGAVIGFSRIASVKPSFLIPSPDGFDTVIHVNREQLLKALQWANMSIEGTQRLSILTGGGPGDAYMEFKNGQQETARFPIEIVSGTELKSDFPVRILAGVVNYVDGSKVALKYGHEEYRTTLEISDPDADPEGILARHFLQSMKER